MVRYRQTINETIIQSMLFACLITESTDTHRECEIPIAFSAVTMDTQTRLIVTFVRILAVLFTQHTVVCPLPS
jgi:hypothetical protein